MTDRIAGRGALLRSLRALLRRIERYGEHRAVRADERRWAARLFDELSAAYANALTADAARAALLAYDQRRRGAQKTRPGAQPSLAIDSQEQTR